MANGGFGGFGGGGVGGGGFDFGGGAPPPLSSGGGRLSLGDLPPIGGDFDEENIRNFAGLLARLAGRQFDVFGGLQEPAAALLKDVLSGGGQLLRQFAGPAISAIQGQIPNAQRRITDSTANRGLAAEGQVRIEESAMQEIGKLLSALQGGLTDQALGVGTNLISQLVGPIGAGGSLLVQRKAAKGGGGGGIS